MMPTEHGPKYYIALYEPIDQRRNNRWSTEESDCIPRALHLLRAQNYN